MNTLNYMAYTKQQDIQPGSVYNNIKDVVGWREQLVFAPIENSSCWRHEFLASLQTLYRTESDLNILFSGGGDSLMTSTAFFTSRHHQRPPHCVCVHRQRQHHAFT